MAGALLLISFNPSNIISNGTYTVFYKFTYVQLHDSVCMFGESGTLSKFKQAIVVSAYNYIIAQVFG